MALVVKTAEQTVFSLHRANAAGYEASFSRFKGVSFQGFQVAMAIIITCLLTSKSYEAETVQMYFDREQLCLQCLSFLGVQGGRQGWDSFSPTQALLAYKSDFCVCFHRIERCWILIYTFNGFCVVTVGQCRFCFASLSPYTAVLKLASSKNLA